MPQNIIKRNGFRGLNAANFLMYLNDNFLKLLAVFGLVEIIHGSSSTETTSLATGIYIFPFLVFLPLAGWLCDRLPKRKVLVVTKLMEVVISCIAVYLFWSQNLHFLYFIMFALGVHTAFFSPAKYGSIPELIETKHLTKANATIEGLAYLAVILGNVLAAFMVARSGWQIWNIAGLSLVFSVLGLFFVWKYIPSIEPVREGKHGFVKGFTEACKMLKKDWLLGAAVAGNAYFWFVGAIIQMAFIPYATEWLGVSKSVGGYMFAYAAIGVGIGAWAAGKVSGDDIEFGTIPVGALGLVIASFTLYFTKNLMAANIVTLLFGVSSGLLLVPLQTFIQEQAPEYLRSEILALSSLVGWWSVLAASGLVYASWKMNIAANGIMLVMGIAATGFFLATIPIIWNKFSSKKNEACFYSE